MNTSSKTPDSGTAKTASARNRIMLYGVGLLLLAIVALTFVRFFGLGSGTATLRTDGHAYNLRIVTSGAAMQRGLGGINSLPPKDGMLFSFQGEAMRCFWMKDMHFPLDIIWLNHDKQVLYVQKEISPATYPDQFCPEVLAQYVIELNAGQAVRAGIQAGQTLTF